jgi:CubicO group peptidase (beta-lactamase class C family)
MANVRNGLALDLTGRFAMRLLRSLTRSLLPSFVLVACAVAPLAVHDRVGAVVDAEMRRQKVPGVAIAVVQHGKPVKVAGYGMANVELGVRVGPSTVFQTGSLAKEFTAVAVMLQVEDGRLGLDDPLTRFFPDAPDSWRSITVRHLLTHTSGIPDYTDGSVDYRKDWTEDELARLAYGLPLEFPAGARWNYSNTGYVLLGIIVGKVSGRFYGDVLRERVFEPLGMKSARVISEEDIVPNRAAGYRLVNGELKNQEWVSPTLNTTADGSLYLSAEDWKIWELAIRSRAILKDSSWAQIFTPVRLNSGKTYPYGFGWLLPDGSLPPRESHTGLWQGFTTAYTDYLQDDLIIVVLCNSADAEPVRFVEAVAGVYVPDLAPTRPLAIPDPEPDVARRVSALLRATAAGELRASDFEYLRAGFFPEAAARYQKLLRDAGEQTRIELLERLELGDDRVYRYRAVFGNIGFIVRVAVAPGGRFAAYGLRRE